MYQVGILPLDAGILHAAVRYQGPSTAKWQIQSAGSLRTAHCEFDLSTHAIGSGAGRPIASGDKQLASGLYDRAPQGARFLYTICNTTRKKFSRYP